MGTFIFCTMISETSSIRTNLLKKCKILEFNDLANNSDFEFTFVIYIYAVLHIALTNHLDPTTFFNLLQTSCSFFHAVSKISSK